jgi:hypothetical protein
MSAITDSFQRIMGPTVSFAGGGGGFGGRSSNKYEQDRERRRLAFEERKLAEELDPMLREERISREGVAGVIRGMRESRAQQRESFFRTPSAQMQGLREGSPTGEAAWKYDQAMRGTPEGRGYTQEQLKTMDPNSGDYRALSQKLFQQMSRPIESRMW